MTAQTMCAHITCSFKAKHNVNGIMYCGHHCGTRGRGRWGNNVSAVARAIVLPRCAGITKRGGQCKRHSSSIHGDSVYCRSHKPYEPTNTSQPNDVSVDQIQDDCSICYNAFAFCKLAMTNCGHLFHKDCIVRWKQSSIYGSTCPLCRRDTHMSRNSSRVQRIYTEIEHYA